LRPGALDASRQIPLISGARVGASSRRRQALLKFYRPDAEALPIRGNVPTRVEKARRGDYDAILLSRAGLQRLKLDAAPLIAFDLNPARWPVAPGQSVIAVEVRSGDEEAMARVAPLNDSTTCERVNAERRLLRAFGGGCHAPFGAFVIKGEDAVAVMVGAPGSDGRSFVITGFRDETIEKACSAAEGWIQSGCMPRHDAAQEGEWVARAARPWC
jgi:hydroxymethylbilane synthase